MLDPNAGRQELPVPNLVHQASSFSLPPILPSTQCPCSKLPSCAKTWTELGSAAYTRGF